MACTYRVFNETDNTRLKPSQASNFFAQGVIDWVDRDYRAPGIRGKVRKLTNAERVVRRAEIARREVSTSNPLHKRGEIPGVKFVTPQSPQWQQEHGASRRETVMRSYPVQVLVNAREHIGYRGDGAAEMLDEIAQTI